MRNLVLFCVLSTRLAFAEGEVLCGKSLADLATQATREIALQQGATLPDHLVFARAVRDSKEEVSRLISKRLREQQELTALGAEVEACGTDGECMAKVAPRLLEKAKMIKEAIGIILGSEKTARNNLLWEAPRLAREWVDANFHRLSVAEVDTLDTGKLKVLVTEELKEAIAGKRQTIGSFFSAIGKHFGNAFSALTFRELRKSRDARVDFRRGLVTTLSIQLSAHLLHTLKDYLTGQPLHFSDLAWLYGNTVFMMSVQAEVGARNQNVKDEPLQISDFESALRMLPEILHGKDGYWAETNQRMYGFFALLPFEYAVSVLLKATAMGITGAGAKLLIPAEQFKLLVGNLVSIGAFGTYLSVRWALLDKWFNLSLLPSLRATTEAEAEIKLQKMKEAGVIPTGWTVRDFYLTAKPPAWWQFWRRPSREAREYYLANPEKFAELFLTKEAKELVEAATVARGASRVEWAWRYGMGLVDAVIIFGLFGGWVDAVPNWLWSLFN